MTKTTLVALFLLASAPVWAVDLSIDQDQKILMPDGSPKTFCLPQEDGGKCTLMIPETVGNVIQTVLTATLLDGTGRGSDPSNTKAGFIAIRIYGQQHPTLSHDDFALILSRVDRTEDPITIARMHEFLEPLDKPATPPDKPAANK